MHQARNILTAAGGKRPARGLLFYCGLLLCTPAGADGPPVVSPQRIEGARLLDAEAMIELATATPELVIVDSRIGASRNYGHIEGSLSLADVDTDCASLEALLGRPDAPVLFYCNGPKCGRSARAVEAALACGYRSVYWFRGGLDEWQTKGYPLVRD